MNTQEFLKHVLPDDGYYCIVGKDKHNNLSHKFIQTLNESQKVIDNLVDLKQDVYFACSTFTTGSNRTADNAKQERALWLDIDCGYDTRKQRWKDYQSKTEGMQAIRAFIDTTGLPDPVIVDSGRGLHVYWAFTDAVVKEVWKPVAEGLKFLCVKHNLKADPACTSDIARILRVPGTFNYKDENKPEPVAVLMEGERHPFSDLASLIPVNPSAPTQTYKRREPDAATKAVLGNRASYFKKIKEKVIAEPSECPQLKYAIENQRIIEEPVWRAALSIAAFCDDAEVYIHDISSQYNGYSPGKTEHKVALIKGAYHCTTFEGVAPGRCDGCPNKGKITSPIQLGNTVKKATIVDNTIEAKSEELDQVITFNIPELPHPYFRGKHGGVYKVTADDEDEGMVIYEYDLYVVERMIDPDPNVGESMWLKLHLPHDGVREFIVPTAQLLSREKAREILVSKGVLVGVAQMNLIVDYIMFSVQYKQRTQQGEMVHKQFGWNAAKNKILIGNREISAFGVKYVPVAEEIKSIANTLTKAGSYTEWQSAINTYARPGMELRAYGFFCGFGSLLMPLIDQNAAVVNLYNPTSGQGKTAILQAMTSIWGNPAINAKLILLKGDTLNSMVHRLGYMNNLPQAVDEVTDPTPQEIHELLKFFTTGRGKNRLLNGVNGERQNDTVFDLIGLLSSNTDFKTVIYKDKGVTSGEVMRLIQLRIEKDHSLTKSEADEIFGKLRHNFGHAGEIFALHVVQNLPTVMKQVKAMHQKIDKEFKLVGEERFFSATHAAVFTGAVIAKQLGIHNIPIQPVYQAIGKEMVLSAADNRSREFDALSSLADFINANLRDVLVINGAGDKRNGMQQAPIVRPLGGVKARIEPDTEMLYIPTSEIRAHCEKYKVNFSDFIKGLSKAQVLVESSKPKDMNKGLDVKAPLVRATWISTKGIDALNPQNFELDMPRNVD